MKEGMIGKFIAYLCVIWFITIFMTICGEELAYGVDEKGNIVIVIDPGHGGTGGGAEDGAINGNVIERFVNMTVAVSMYDELSKYEGVKVYLTHDNPNVAMSLKERSEFAVNVNADFLFSLHFNASEEHDKYGLEVWIPSIGDYYAAGYQFANIELEELKSLDLFIRGIKTRVDDDGEEYYGIIRECEWRNINAVIIEHCYIDNISDKIFVDNDMNLKKFGVKDATAVAKYFGLKSSELGVDYSSIEKVNAESPSSRIYQDLTPPETCSINLIKAEKGSINFQITARDADSGINYYAFSLDGGKTFSELMQWNDVDKDGTVEIIIANVNKNVGNLVVKVYNRYDNYVESNVLNLTNIQKAADNKGYVEKIQIFFRKNNKKIATILVTMCGIIITIVLIKRKH